MMRPALSAFAVGLSGLAGVALLGWLGHAAVMPSYLGAWMVVLALPVGALPLAMGLELLGREGAPILPVLRRLVALMPLAALLAIPVLLRVRGLYPALAHGAAGEGGLPAWWMTPGFFLARAVLYLVLWTGLAFMVARPPVVRRPGLAIGGLCLHAILGTLAAIDWMQALEPAFVSSASGLLLMTAQSGLAVAVAVVLATLARSSDPWRETSSDGPMALALVVLLGVWGFLIFTQYLVVWSANLPKEVAWYQHRSAGLGQAAEYAAAILYAIVLACLSPRGLARRTAVLASAAAGVALLHGLEMFWLVTPAFRSAFNLTLADLLAFLGMTGLGIGWALLFDGSGSSIRRLDRGAA